jgi:hypothetical protein
MKHTTQRKCPHVPHNPDTMQTVCELCSAEVFNDPSTGLWMTQTETVPAKPTPFTSGEVCAMLKIDFNLLRRQKLALIELKPGTTVTSEQSAAAEGLLNILDAIQDQALRSGEYTEKQIFG